jgi:hypothetical protein
MIYPEELIQSTGPAQTTENSIVTGVPGLASCLLQHIRWLFPLISSCSSIPVECFTICRSQYLQACVHSKRAWPYGRLALLFRGQHWPLFCCCCCTIVVDNAGCCCCSCSAATTEDNARLVVVVPHETNQITTSSTAKATRNRKKRKVHTHTHIIQSKQSKLRADPGHS